MAKKHKQRMDEELRQRMMQLEIVQQVDRALLSAATVPEIATAVLHHIHQILPAMRATIVTFDDAEQTATILTAVETDQAPSITTHQLPLAKLSLPDFFYQGEMSVVEEFAPTDQSTEIEQAVYDAGIRAFISVPLLIQGELVGLFNLGMNTPQKFSDQQLRFVSELALPL
jgi:GAF domain-containing protein